MPASKKIRYGVAGLGHIAQVAVLPAFGHARRNSTLAAIISGDGQKLAEVGDTYRVPLRVSYDGVDEALGRIDALYISTPNTEHSDLAVRAAHAGVHVLCEKPLATTDAECQRIILACREANVKIMTAYRLHFEPITLEVIDLVRKGRIGDLRYFSSSFSFVAKPGNIRTRPETGGGTLYDIGIYCINAARMLFGTEPTRVFAMSIDGTRAGFPAAVDETTSCVLHFDGDRLATFTASFGSADVSSYRIVGTEGDIVVQPAYEYAEPLAYTLTVDGKATKKKGRKVDQFAAELLYFSDCILKDREPEPSVEEGAWDLRIIDALYESARRQEPVALRPEPPHRRPDPSQKMSLPPVQKPEVVNAEAPHD
jgi:predicted dehydrogenase